MSSALRRMFETMPNLEEAGVVLQYTPEISIVVARAGGANKKFAKVMNKLAKPHRRAIDAEMLDPQIGEKLMLEVYAKAIIKGWTGITKDILTKDNADTELLDFNEDNVMAVMKALPDLFADVQKMSQTLAVYQAETLEGESGN